jgi:hypothetical protein
MSLAGQTKVTRGTRAQRRRRGMMLAGQRTRGFQAPVGRQVAPPELARIGETEAINMTLLGSYRSPLKLRSVHGP